MSKKWATILRRGLVLFMVMVTFSGCGIMPKEEETLAPPLIQPEIITYKTVKPTTGFIEDSINVTGSFIPVMIHDIFFSSATSRMKAIYVKPGDAVEKGAVLVELYAEDIQRELNIQKILLDSKQKDLAYTQQSTKLDLENAEKRLAEDAVKYQMMLDNPGVFSFDEVALLKKSVEDQTQNLEKLKLNTEYQLNAKENDLKIAQININKLNVQVEQSTLKAPVDGTITYTASIKEGEFFEAYKTIVRVADMKSLQLEYKGDMALKFGLNGEVDVTVNKVDYKGTVVFVPSMAPVDDRQSLSNIIRIVVKDLPVDISNTDKANIKLTLKSADNAIIIPRNAIKLYLGKQIVYVLEDNIRVQKFIEVGIESVNSVQVLAGLSVEDNIIIE